MAFTPISNTAIQYAKNADGASASGYYLKFYANGTTTPINMATDSTGGTTLAKCQLNSLGYPINGSSDVFIPHIDQDYKLALYTTATDADSNTLASAAWVVDNLSTSSTGSVTSTNGTLRTIIEWVDRQAQTYTTADAAKADTALSVGDMVQTLGRSSVGDGGSGLYYVVAAGTGTDDGGSFINSNPAGSFQLQLIDEEPNIIQWGADKTGTTDSINEINAANAWAPNVGKMITPKGDFLVSQTIKWKSNATYEGFGKSSRYFCAVDANINLSQAETISAVSGEYDENITICNLQLDHNRLTDFTVEVYMSLLLVGSRNIFVDNVFFTNPNTDGIYINYEYGGTGNSANQPDNIRVTGCTFTGDNHNRNGISIISGADFKIDNCRFIGMTRDDMPGAIDMEPNNATNVIEGVSISNCYFNLCKASIVSDYVPNNSNTQIRNINIDNIIINSSSPHTTSVPNEFFGHTGIAMAHARGVRMSNVNIKDTAHASVWLADLDDISITNLRAVSPTAAVIARDLTDFVLDAFYLESTNATTFTSVVTNGLYMRYETTGAGHTGVRRGKISNGTINCTAGAATTNSAILGEGNIQDIEIDNVFLMGNWANGIVQSNGSSGDALRWTVRARIEDGNSMTPYVAAFDGAVTASGNGEWFIPNVTDGVATFSAETSKVITVGDFAKLATARMMVSAVDDQGTIGLSADRTSATQFTITASSAFTGDVNWKIVHS